MNEVNNCFSAERINAEVENNVYNFKSRKMKSKITKALIIAIFGSVVGYALYETPKKEVALSDVVLDNIEALATIEGWIGTPIYRIEFHQMWHWTCYPGGNLKCPV